MVAQAEAESKQLKFMAEKTKAMSEYAQVMIDVIDEHTRTKIEQAKAVAEEREEQSQSQVTILKANLKYRWTIEARSSFSTYKATIYLA